MPNQEEIKVGLKSIFAGITHLRNSFPGREFTIDGRLVGDIGEVIAELVYDIKLDEVSQADHDGTTSDGWRVQIKATFQDALTFKKVPNYYLGLKLHKNGEFEEIYNGPGQLIFDKYSHRKGIGCELLRFPNSDLKNLSAKVNQENRVQRRQN